MNDPIFPNWPPRADHVCYEYLASVGITESRLDRCCIKEVEVVGVTDRQKVTVRYNDTDYPNIPVFVHTDIGARRALVLGEQYEDASEYFKDAALMFPFPGGSGYYTPMVLAVVYSNPETSAEEVLCIYNVVQTVTTNFESNKPPMTYRVYVKYRIANVMGDSYNGESLIGAHYSLYDLINDCPATIPSYSDTVPALPMIEASNLTSQTAIDAFIATGVRLPFEVEFTNHPPADNMWLKEEEAEYVPRGCTTYAVADYPYISVPNCLYEDGTEESPGWEVTIINPDGGGGYDPDSIVEKEAFCECYDAYAWYKAYSPLLGVGSYQKASATNTMFYRSDSSAYGIGNSAGSGKKTYTNGLEFDTTVESSYNYDRYENTIVESTYSYSVNETITYNGVVRTRSITLSEGIANVPVSESGSLHAWERKSVWMRLPPPLTNFFTDMWCWEPLEIYKEIPTPWSDLHSYAAMNYETSGWFSPTFAVRQTRMFENIKESLISLLESNAVLWDPTREGYSSSYNLQIDFLGFYFVPYDVRVDKLLAES